MTLCGNICAEAICHGSKNWFLIGVCLSNMIRVTNVILITFAHCIGDLMRGKKVGPSDSAYPAESPSVYDTLQN